MVTVDADFHTLITAPGAQTRIRIYFIDDTVDCTDDNDVETNGTLLAYDADTDSNAYIDLSSGLSIFESFNKDEDLTIGSAASYHINCSFLNFNNTLSNFGFGRCKIYVDVWDGTNEVWLPCPLGVFIIDIPVKRRVRIITASGYDQMSYFDGIADDWWNGLDFDNGGSGLTISDIIQGLAGTIGVSLSANALTNIVNDSVTFTESPFTSVQMTYREILSFLAGATGTVAKFDRNGALDFVFFDEAQIGGVTVEVDTDDPNTSCIGIDVAEYEVNAIDLLSVRAAENDIGASVGSGSNEYSIINNPLLGGADEAEMTTKATPIYNRLNDLGSFTPIHMRVVADPSIEAGDIINVVYKSDTFSLPIFQQTLSWRGGYVGSVMLSCGNATRPSKTAAQRQEFRSQTMMHKFEVTLDQLLSRIESIDGDYTQIQQTVDAITNTVYNESDGLVTKITNILDPTGEIWTAISGNSSDLADLEDALNDEIGTRQRYIRFIPAEPAIVLGVDADNEIKLKLVNNIIYFFNGSDDSTDTTLAYAYFNSQEAGAERFTAKESVQAGNWIWKQLSNGNFVLDYVQ